MSERAKKSIGQDLVGSLFCLLGGFFLVSIVLSWMGQEPVFPLATRPVLELVALFGALPAGLFSLGVAVLGAWIFLASLPPAVGRPLGALALGVCGFALILGAFALGGSLGDVFPSLISGTAGRLIGAVLGVGGILLALTLVAPRGPAASPADVMRAAIGGRAEHASGVSSAEAALLVSEPRPAARPAPRREEPLREETLRPIAPEKPRVVAPATRPLEAVSAAPAAELPRPLAPAWESEPDEAEEPEEADAAEASATQAEDELAAELVEALHADAEEEPTDEDEPAVLAPPNAEPASSERTPPSASWEQVSLFDEPEEAEEAEPVQPPRSAATGALDFGEPARPSHEPERGNADDPFAAEPLVAPARTAAEPIEAEEEFEELAAELEEEEEALEEEVEESLEEEPAVVSETRAAVRPVEPPIQAVQPPPASIPARPAAPAPKAAPQPASAPEFVLQPKPAPRHETVVVSEGESEKWQKLVFDSGLLIVEQKRVAVSMLERRFGIDFDTACRVLDELQQAGLIGPYIGGRTREILLSREQWLAQAAETA